MTILRRKRGGEPMGAVLVAVSVLLAGAPVACGGVPTPAAGLVRMPEYQPLDQTKCKVAASQKRPLIVEWPSADRAALEAQTRQGLVVVRYTGCEMEMLPSCRVKDATCTSTWARRCSGTWS